MKKLIFIGGEAGVGKSTIADFIQKNHDGKLTIIDKDESTSVFTSYILESNSCKKYDRESLFYQENVKPLEYKQLDILSLHSLKNNSVIVTAPFFDSFRDIDWINLMKFEAEFKNASVHFFYLIKNTELIRKGLIERNEERDTWKNNNYEEYRRNINLINQELVNIKDINIINLDLDLAFRSIQDIL